MSECAVSTPVARKRHWCCECGYAILPGCKYERLVSFGDGGAYTDKRCLSCVAWIEGVRDHIGNSQQYNVFDAFEYWEGLDFWLREIQQEQAR